MLLVNKLAALQLFAQGLQGLFGNLWATRDAERAQEFEFFDRFEEAVADPARSHHQLIERLQGADGRGEFVRQIGTRRKFQLFQSFDGGDRNEAAAAGGGVNLQALEPAA